MLNSHGQEDAGTYQKRCLVSKDKEEPTARWQEGHNHDKIKSHTHQWVTHQLESNNTTEVLPLLWRFGTQCQAFPACRPDKGTGNSQGIWSWSPGGFYYKTSTGLRETETLGLESQSVVTQLCPTLCDPMDWRAQTKPCLHQDSEEGSSDATGGWTQTTC